MLKTETNNVNATYFPKGELVIIENGTGKAIYAYKFDIYAENPISRAYVYVNADNRTIASIDPIIKHVDSNGSAATRYSGTQNIITDAYKGKYRLRNAAKGVQTYNMRLGTSYSGAVDFMDSNNAWTEYNNTTYDNAALDAHWGAEKVYDFWKTRFNRNSYDNRGALIKSYVHFSSNYDNAFWDGYRMTYGDGGSYFKPLTSLDVCAHEIGHAICSYTANLMYQNEPGAINEGLSDIWAAVIEDFAAPTKQNGSSEKKLSNLAYPLEI